MRLYPLAFVVMSLASSSVALAMMFGLWPQLSGYGPPAQPDDGPLASLNSQLSSWV